TEKDFFSAIQAVVKNKLNIMLPHDIVHRLTRLTPSVEEKNIVVRQKEMDNIWKLVQNNEYLLSVIYADVDVFPKLLGTCGSFFAVEYVEPLQSASALLGLSDNRENWSKRLKTALHILQL